MNIFIFNFILFNPDIFIKVFSISLYNFILFEFIIFDNCGVIHFINDVARFDNGSFKIANFGFCVLAGLQSLKIKGYGIRIFKKILKGKNFIFENVTVIL